MRRREARSMLTRLRLRYRCISFAVFATVLTLLSCGFIYFSEDRDDVYSHYDPPETSLITRRLSHMVGVYDPDQMATSYEFFIKYPRLVELNLDDQVAWSNGTAQPSCEESDIDVIQEIAGTCTTCGPLDYVLPFKRSDGSVINSIHQNVLLSQSFYKF